ncbi:MAG: hypothetical protein U0T75_08305 [Chitinophagales bacterium]
MREKSPHILSSSTNLLGFCLIILTGIKITRSGDASYVDEIAAITAFLLMMSCLFSFLSIRAELEAQSEKMENIADYIFLVSLVLLSCTIILITFNVLR